MILALDFDRTLFDTDSDNAAIALANVSHLIGDPAVNSVVDPSPFLFPDVIPFLELRNQGEVYIVSAVTARFGPRSRDYQRDKIEKAGVASRVAEVVLTGDSKVEALREIAARHSGARVALLDDRTDVLIEVQDALPEIVVVHMSRNGAKVMSDAILPPTIPSVCSLEEFERVISHIKK